MCKKQIKSANIKVMLSESEMIVNGFTVWMMGPPAATCNNIHGIYCLSYFNGLFGGSVGAAHIFIDVYACVRVSISLGHKKC